MIYYSINYRSPFEKDKMLLNFLQLSNESIHIRNKINRQIEEIEEIEEIEKQFSNLENDSTSENLFKLISSIN